MQLFEQQWFIEAPWGRLCIVAWGNCLNPPVLVLHGGGDSLATFRPLLRHLPKNFYYVGMELPGLGRSDPYPPGVIISTMDLVYCIEIVRRHFRWEQFIFMAHSLGATIGRLYNLTTPGRVAAAIELDQLNLGLVFPPEEFSRWYNIFYGRFYQKYQQINSPKETRPKYTWDQAIERVRKRRPELTPDLARETIERFSEPAGDGLIRFTYDPRWPYFVRPPFTPEHIKTLYTSIKTPTLAIVAETSIQRGLYERLTLLLEDHNNYRVRKIPGGHDVHVSHPERVAPFVTQFLLYGLPGLDARSKL